MKSNRKQLSQRGVRSRKTGFYSLATVLLVAALSLSAMVLAGAPSLQPSHSGKSIPVAIPPQARPSGVAVAPGTGADAEGSFHPGMLPVVAGAWTAEGPAPIQNGQASTPPAMPPNNFVIGAIQAIAAHPSDPNTIFAGGANGGIWRSSDGGTTWTAQTDANNSLSIGSLKFDPTDGTHATLIAGIGRFSNLAQIGGPQSGVLLTTDGSTWLDPSGGGPGNPLSGSDIIGVAARGKILLAASNTGMYRSTDTGGHFALISNGGASGLPAGTYFDIAETPTAKVIPDGVVMVSDGFGGVEEWGNNGKFINTIFTGSFQDAGSTFDTMGNFVVTLFGGESLSEFDPTGLFLSDVGSGPFNEPESIEQDNMGNFVNGNAGPNNIPADPSCVPTATNFCEGNYCDPTPPYQCYSRCYQPQDGNPGTTYPYCPVLVFDSNFNLVHTWYPEAETAPVGLEQVDGRGTDWGALVPVPVTNPITPQCVLRYTSEGILVKQFNICTGTQMADFASGLPGENAFELQIAPNGDTFVADTEQVVRLDSSGNVVQTYLSGIGASVDNPIFAMNFDPDGTSFWTGTVGSGDVYKVDIATGTVLVHFTDSSGVASGISVKVAPIYTSVIGAGALDGVYKSKDWGASWTQVFSNATLTNNLLIDGTTQNIKVAVGTAPAISLSVLKMRASRPAPTLVGGCLPLRMVASPGPSTRCRPRPRLATRSESTPVDRARSTSRWWPIRTCPRWCTSAVIGNRLKMN